MFWKGAFRMFSLRLILIVIVTIMILDISWIGFIANAFYQKESSNFAPIFNYAAPLLYIVMALGFIYFVIQNPSVKTLRDAIYIGAFFGFVLYAVYDLTGLAVVRDYSWKLSIVDILWGTFLGGVVGGVGKYFA